MAFVLLRLMHTAHQPARFAVGQAFVILLNCSNLAVLII